MLIIGISLPVVCVIAVVTAGCGEPVRNVDIPIADDPAARKPNRLAQETSPYLLMHAQNPVDWYPWGEGALSKARRENKLVFLSIGYSSCHWCHVMERESFMDDEIAAFLNKHFVCIKVDREERPDLDAIFMTAVQIVTRRGGWPMSVFLAPDARPFFGGTYFPARDNDRPETIGFLTLIRSLQNAWTTKPDKVMANAEQLTQLVKTQLDGQRSKATEPLDGHVLSQVQAALALQYDSQYGGFGFSPVNPSRPKFPEPSNLLFLIHRVDSEAASDAARTEARRMLVGTLDGLATGGIRDHIGGGFHRYSVDRSWQIPHFEKMLYDNGQLATVFAEAYRITGREDYRRVIDELARFVLREMTDDGGAFYAAIGADSEGVEGKYYRWQRAEVERQLGADAFALFRHVYGLDQAPNFEDEFHVPLLARPLSTIAAEMKLAEDELDARLQSSRDRLLAVRGQRSRPLTDTKILTAWNGLMIRGLADAGRLLPNQEYLDAAARAAQFVLNNLRTTEGRLLRTYGQGKAKIDAYLDDYAMLVDGLIALHRATDDEKWLAAADELTQMQIKLFWNTDRGGFFFTADSTAPLTGADQATLISRAANPADGARPSGNSVSAGNLIHLAKLLGKAEYLDRAEQTIQAAAPYLEQRPAAMPRMAVALAELLTERPPAPSETTATESADITESTDENQPATDRDE